MIDGHIRSAIKEDPEIRRVMLNGVTARGSLPLILAIGAVGGIALFLLIDFALTSSVCLFGRIGRSVLCQSAPDSPTANWWLGGGAVLLGVLFGNTYRVSLLKGYKIIVEPFNQLTLAHGLALLAGWLIGFLIVLDKVGIVRDIPALIFVLSGPLALAVWTGAHRRLTGIYIGRRARTALAHGVRQLVVEKLWLNDPVPVHAELSNRKIIVKGPFDCVDSGRVKDLILTHFDRLIEEVDVETTLDETSYWKYKFAELGPSGYVSPPIPKPLEIPTWLFACAIALCVAVMAGMYYYGGVLTLDKFAGQMDDALGRMGMR